MNEDAVIQKLLDHDQQFQEIRSAMATKDDIRELKELVEEVVTITKKIREDHVFALEWLKRLQDKVDRQEEQIQKIMVQLHLA